MKLEIGKKYEPLSFYEIERGEPFRIKIAKNTFLEFNLPSALKTDEIFLEKDKLLHLAQTENSREGILALNTLQSFIFESRVKKFWLFELGLKKKWRRFMLEGEVFFNFLNTFLKWQTRIFFLLKETMRVSPFQTEIYSRTGSDASQPDMTLSDLVGLTLPSLEKLKNNKTFILNEN